MKFYYKRNAFLILKFLKMWIELILTGLILYFVWNILKKPSEYPPGLWGFPVFGYIPLSIKNFDTKFQELKKKHGDIFCWKIGSKVVVFLCDYKTVKETFHSFPYASRPQLSFMSMLADQTDVGIILTNGPHWHSIRKFTLRHLRDLGMGKSKMETAVQQEAMEFVNELKKQAGKPAPVTRALKPAIINVLWQMVAGKRYDLDDKTIIEFDNLMHNLQEAFAKAMFEDMFPWVATILPKTLLNAFVAKDLQRNMSNHLIRIFEVDIKEHVATLDITNPRDYIDEYLIEMEKQKSDPESKMSMEDLMGCIADLFGAGFETTAVTIYWSILYMASFPEVQKKVQKEVDSVLPEDIQASLDDKLRLPYTEAFINEVLRFSSLTAFGIPRTVLSDTKLGGYTIPKDAIVVSASQDLHFDSEYFDSPKEFRPERFLNDESKAEIPKSGFLPFGIGKRICLGESLARMELLIFMTTMVKYVNFSVPPNKKLDLRPRDMPMFNQPRMDQEVLITIRN